MEERDERARALNEIAEDLETAAAHCRVASTHLTNEQIPRFAAHCWAAHGHVDRASRRLSSESVSFADRSRPVISDES